MTRLRTQSNLATALAEEMVARGTIIDRFRRMDAAYADMLANATKFDGSYERARERFEEARRG